MNRLRSSDVCFHGDPDLQPIRTFENAALVRVLHALSCQFNDAVSFSEIKRISENKCTCHKCRHIYSKSCTQRPFNWGKQGSFHIQVVFMYRVCRDHHIYIYIYIQCIQTLSVIKFYVLCNILFPISKWNHHVITSYWYSYSFLELCEL